MMIVWELFRFFKRILVADVYTNSFLFYFLVLFALRLYFFEGFTQWNYTEIQV